MAQIAPALIQAFGPYCATCERVLNDDCWLWFPASGFVYPADYPFPIPHDLVEWGPPLLLDHCCARAAYEKQDAYLDHYAGALWLPEFPTGPYPTPPFEYGPADITVISTRDGGDMAARSETSVLVRPMSPAAELTIHYFALNSPRFDPVRDVREVRASEENACIDRRVEDRTHAWTRAHEAVSALLDAEGLTGDTRRFDNQLRLTIADSGFWSVWATVLHQRLPDADLRRIDHILGLPADPEPRRGPGPHNPFPGTRFDRGAD
jgi:hypothetical protein